MSTRRQFLNIAGAALAASALPRRASGQSWPTKPIRAMIPFTAGSTVDIIGRIVLDPLSSQLGQPIIVENRGGAGGTIGSAMVANAEPDGHTLLIQASAHSAAPAAYPNIPYDPARDFSAVVPFGSVPNVTVISSAKGIKTLRDLVAAAKAGSLTFASAGVGSATHWAAERLRLSAGFNAVHVPFRGGPEALTEVVAGRVDFMCIGVSSGLAFIREGRLLPLAVSTPKRSPALPNVMTTLEAGFPRLRLCLLDGDARARENAARHRQQTAPGDAESAAPSQRGGKVSPQGIDPMPLAPAEFDALIRKEIASNAALVKAAGLKFN